MTRVKVFCSIRLDEQQNASVQLFSDLECAEADQALQPHYQNLGKKFLTSFTFEVTGVAYVDEVMTKSEYISYLNNLPQTNYLEKLIKTLKTQ